MALFQALIVREKVREDAFCVDLSNQNMRNNYCLLQIQNPAGIVSSIFSSNQNRQSKLVLFDIQTPDLPKTYDLMIMLP